MSSYKKQTNFTSLIRSDEEKKNFHFNFLKAFFSFYSLLFPVKVGKNIDYWVEKFHVKKKVSFHFFPLLFFSSRKKLVSFSWLEIWRLSGDGERERFKRVFRLKLKKEKLFSSVFYIPKPRLGRSGERERRKKSIKQKLWAGSCLYTVFRSTLVLSLRFLFDYISRAS